MRFRSLSDDARRKRPVLQSDISSLVEGKTAVVRDYWDRRSTRIRVPDKEWGSKEFFEAIKRQHDRAYEYANRLLGCRKLADKTLLEVGCGIGLDTVQFVRCGARVHAIDLSPGCVELARRHLAHRQLRATVEVGDAQKLPFGAGVFDIVVARGILSFTPQPRRVIDEIVRVLRPAGVIQGLLHNRLSWYPLLARVSGSNLLDKAEDPPVFRLYSIREVRDLFRNFERVELFLDKFPTKTARRSGAVARLYNDAFVPLTGLLPKRLVRPLGYYIIVQAAKPAGQG